MPEVNEVTYLEYFRKKKNVSRGFLYPKNSFSSIEYTYKLLPTCKNSNMFPRALVRNLLSVSFRKQRDQRNIDIRTDGEYKIHNYLQKYF